MSDPRLAVHTDRVAIQEREREKAVKCEDLNDSSSSTPHKLEMMEDNSQKLKISFFFLVVFIGKPGLVLTRGKACQWIPPRNKQRVLRSKTSINGKMGWVFVLYYLIYEKYLVLYILQVLSHHNYWLCRCKLLAQCADKTYANCKIFWSSSTLSLSRGIQSSKSSSSY